MATIPMGNGGRAMPGRAPALQPQNVGQASARALEDFGRTGVQIGLQAQADETRLQAQQMAEQQAVQRQEQQRQQATAEAAARAKDALQLQTVEDALADAHDTLGAEVLQGRTPKADADKQWAERSRKILDDSMPGFREQARELVQPRLQGSALRLGNTLRRTVEKKDRQDVTADMTTRLERLSRDYMVDPARAEAEAMTLFDTLGPFSDMPADQVARARQGWKEQAQFTAGYEAVSKGRADRKALADAEKLIGGLSSIDPQKRAVLLDRAQGYRLHLDQQDEMRQARAARAAEAAMRRAGAEFETFQTMADKGTAMDPAYLDRVLSATAGTPYQAGVRALAQQAKENGGLAAQPVTVQQQMLTAIDTQIAQQGRTPELDKRRTQIEKVLSGAEADLKRDPLRAGLERGVITDLQPLNLSGGVDGIVQQLGVRVGQAGNVSQWAGRAVSPLTSDEASGFARLLGNMPADQKGQALSVLSAAMPPAQAQALAAQIDDKDRPLSLALAAGASRTTQGRTVSELILRGAQAVKDKAVKEEKGAEFGVRAVLAKEVGDMLPEKWREDIIDAARLIYLGKQAAGESISERGALALALGGPVVEHNGRKVPVPVGLDADTLRQRLQALPERLISAQVPDGFVYMQGGRPMGVPEFLSALPGAQLDPLPGGRYMVRIGGSLALKADRRPVVVEVRP